MRRSSLPPSSKEWFPRAATDVRALAATPRYVLIAGKHRNREGLRSRSPDVPGSRLSGFVHPADRIVVPVEGTDREFIAQQWAVEFAAAMGVGVAAFHVATSARVPPPGVFAFLQEACTKWGVPLDTQVLAGEDVVEELLPEMKTRDLVIIGTRRLAGHYHLGSVSLELIRRAPCPVQVVRIE